MIMTPGKNFAPWVLFLEWESCLSCINLDYKNLNNKLYTAIFKNRMQNTLGAIIGENQSAAIKNRPHIFFHLGCN